MSLWNPYTFGIGGAPALLGAAPPALRIMGGTATPEQLAAARMVFSRFCALARTSPVPNPTEIGSLPDGSRYQIVVVGPSSVMNLWPARGEGGPFLSGVGIPVLAPSDPPGGYLRYLFVLSHHGGQWHVTTPKAFYGGRGLWASKEDSRYYLTYVPRGAEDDNLYWPAHDAEVQQRPQYPAGTVAGPGGIAYETGARPVGSADPSQGGMVAVSGGFVQPTVSSYVLIGPGIYLAGYADRDAIKETPLVAAQQTTGYVPVDPVLPPNISKPFTPFDVSMLRSGARMATPLIDMRYKLLDQEPYHLISAYAITHEISINTTGAQPIVSINTVGKEVIDDGLKDRIYTVTREVGLEVQSITQHSQNVNGLTMATRAIGVWCRRTDKYRVHRPFKAQGTVFTGYGWKDDLVNLWVEITGGVEFEQATEQNTDLGLYWKVKTAGTGVGFVSILRGSQIHADCDFTNDTSSVPQSYESGGLFYDYTASMPDPPVGSVGSYDPPLVGRPAELMGTSQVKSANRQRMHTPWGHVDLLDSDYTIELTAASGTIVRRSVRYIDVVLGVIVFGEARTSVRNATDLNYIELETKQFLTVWHRDEFILTVAEGTSVGTIPRRQILTFGVEGAPIDYRRDQLNQSLSGTFDAPYFLEVLKIVGGVPGERISFGVAGQTDVNWSAELLQKDTQTYRTTLEQEAYGSLDTIAPYTAQEYTVESALDPQSGGGVVFVKKGAVLHGAWAIAPGGVRTPLSAHLAGRKGNPYSPGAIVEAVVSV